MTFHDREQEIQALQDAFDATGPSFYVLYGRRRVGKTALLKQFCSRHPHLYFLAAEEAEARQREKLVKATADRFGDHPPRIDGWMEALDYLGEKLNEQPLAIVIDEFPYLVSENDSLPSYLQAFVDESLEGTESMLILCGSSISIMESSVLAHKSPLYGRRTGQIDLQPFTFKTARHVIAYDIEDAIRSYSVTGGIPMYLELFDYENPLDENIREHVLTPTAVLYNEPEFLLRTELRNPARYMSILESLALGHTTPNTISGATGIDPGPLSKYLQTLRRLRIVDRTIPITASQKKSKRSRYHISDEFLRFWFRYVEPNRSNIEQAPDIVLEGTIQPDLPMHASSTFERVCQEAVWESIRQRRVAPYSRVGPWWFDEDEIDIVALAPDDDRILLAECKWTNDPVGRQTVRALQEKAERVRWGSKERHERFAIFSKSGFVDGLQEDLSDAWTLFDLPTLDALLQPAT